jgi:hypothetical protein
MLALPPDGHYANDHFELVDLIEMTLPGSENPPMRFHEAYAQASQIMVKHGEIQSMCYIVRNPVTEQDVEIDLVQIDNKGVIKRLWRFTDLSQ